MDQHQQQTENNPLVSIIIPAYNRAGLIGETLQSVINQTYTNWECIVVDDGSTDNTKEVVKEYTSVYSNIQFHLRTTAPKGAPTCRNVGFQHSEGEYVLFLDSDDLLPSNFLISQVQSLQNTKFGAVISSIKTFQNEIAHTSEWPFQNNDISLINYLNGTCAWRTSAVLWKRTAYKKTKGFHPELKAYQDWHLHIQHFAKGDSFLHNLETFIYYRTDYSDSTISQLIKGKFNVEDYLKPRMLILKLLFFRLSTSKKLRKALLVQYNIDYNKIKSFKIFFVATFHLLLLSGNFIEYLAICYRRLRNDLSHR